MQGSLVILEGFCHWKAVGNFDFHFHILGE